MAGDGSQGNVLAERLDHLFATVHPRDRRPYTLREVADAINAEAGATIISVSYLSQLRAGQRTPVFRISGVYERLTWYMRLPHGGSSPWAGIVRVECSAEVPEHQAVSLADLSTALEQL